MNLRCALACLWCCGLFLLPLPLYAGDHRAVTIDEEQHGRQTDTASTTTGVAAQAAADHANPTEARAEPAPIPPDANEAQAHQALPAGAAFEALTEQREPGESRPAASEILPAPTSTALDALPTAESVNLKDVVAPAQSPVSTAAPTPEATATPVAASANTSPPLVLLGAKVAPGTSTRLAWSPEESFAGIAASTPVLVVHGVNPGPTLCVTGAVHGDELNGVEIVRRLMYELDPQKLSGSVIGVPIVNLQGFRRASRYLPDRRDLNRYFPGYASGSSASRIAHSFFSEVVRHCNFLVDLHTGSFRRTNLPQLRADLKVPEVAQLVEHLGAIVVLQSQGAQGSLRRAAVEHGIPAVTLEAGEPHSVQKDAVNEGVKSLETLLHKRNMYPQRGLWARRSEPTFYKSLWVRAPAGGILVSDILLGERVQLGDKLGTITDPITNQATVVSSPIRGRVIGMAVNQVMLPGYAAYHIGYQSTLEEAAEGEVGPDDTAADEALDETPLSGHPEDVEAVLDAE